MEIKEILTLVLFAVLMALNIVAFDRIGMLRKKTKKLEAEVNDCSLTAEEALDRTRINGASIKELKERFEEEIRENLEASAEKERKEAEAQQSFIDGLRNIIDFDGWASPEGEK